MRQMKIVCNKCGREITNEDILEVEKRWGYFSNNKDNLFIRFGENKANCSLVFESRTATRTVF